MTPEQKIEDSELIKQIAWMAWKGAANAYRLYPDNNHTFTDYWAGAESQFDEFKKLIAGRSAGLEREKELEEVLKLAAKKYADEMTNPFCMEWYKQATKLLNK